MDDDLNPNHYRKPPRSLLRLILIGVAALCLLAVANISGLIGLALVVVAIGFGIQFCLGVEVTALRLGIFLSSAAIGVSLCVFHLKFGDDTAPSRRRRPS